MNKKIGRRLSNRSITTCQRSTSPCLSSTKLGRLTEKPHCLRQGYIFVEIPKSNKCHDFTPHQGAKKQAIANSRRPLSWSSNTRNIEEIVGETRARKLHSSSLRLRWQRRRNLFVSSQCSCPRTTREASLASISICTRGQSLLPFIPTR